MSDLDEVAPHFAMAHQRWPMAPTLRDHYQSVRTSYSGNGHGLIGEIKSFLECVSRTILREHGREAPPQPSPTDLLVAALSALGLRSARGASGLGKLLSAHNKLTDALGVMRNEEDPVAHGKDGFLDALTVNERRAFLLTADTILALLLNAHDGTEPSLEHTREPYDRFQHLHDRIDGIITADATVEEDRERQVVVIELRSPGLPDGVRLRIEPSKLLYAIDRTAYVGFLASASQEVESPMVVKEAVTHPYEVPDLRRAPEPADPQAAQVPEYHGRLEALKPALKQYIAKHGLPAVSGRRKAQLTDSLLAAAEPHMGLDWTAREPLRAGLKVAARRTLLEFGTKGLLAEQFAAELAHWFAKHAPSTEPERPVR